MLGILHASTRQAEADAAWPAANIPVPVGYFTDIYEVARFANYGLHCVSDQVQVTKFEKYLWDLSKYETQKRETSVQDVGTSQSSEEPRGQGAVRNNSYLFMISVTLVNELSARPDLTEESNEGMILCSSSIKFRFPSPSSNY